MAMWSKQLAPFDCHVRLSSETEDSEWDAFLAQTRGGHHLQTSLWGQIKGVLGWRTVRTIVSQGGRIVAGGQMLVRRLPLAGAIGYVPRGPLFAFDDPLLIPLVIDTMHQVAKAHRIRCLLVQPPCNGGSLARQLLASGFQRSAIAIAPPSTVLLDLTQDHDTILAKMKPKTRYNLRLGQRQPIVVREGTATDLPAFHHLLAATGQRQGFSPPAEDYFASMWRILRPHGYINLFLAERAGEPLSGFLVIPFGDTVIYKRGAWSGHYHDLRPNEVLHWTIINWAKARGYRYYDFEGIDPTAARALLEGAPLPDSLTASVTRFKLGFGGRITFFPETYQYIYNTFLRWAYHTVYPTIGGLPPVVRNMLNRLR
jgi:peptidoglycan pentaglycine glycine transferase (the first glycine)